MRRFDPHSPEKAYEFPETQQRPITTETPILAFYGPARRGGNSKLRRLQLQGSKERKSGEQIST